MNKVAYCYIINDDDPNERVYLVRHAEEKAYKSAWGFICVNVSCQTDDKREFYNNFAAKLMQKAYVGQITGLCTFDVSSKGEYWVRVSCHSNAFNINEDNAVESALFEFSTLQKLNADENLQEFNTNYPNQVDFDKHINSLIGNGKIN